jgi:transposase InsO family protein
VFQLHPGRINKCGNDPKSESNLGDAMRWVDWFNNRCLLEPIGNVPPTEAEAAYYAQLEVMPMAA